MRDYIVLAVILLSAPLSLFSPFYGVLVWTWIADFNPHRYAWGFAHDFPVAIVIAIPTLLGAIFAAKNTRIFVRETILLASLWAWFAITTYYISTVTAFSGHVQDATTHLQDISKIMLMTFVTIVLITSKEKLRLLVLVIIASFGFRCLFAAIFFIKTGGQYKIWGPEGTFLYDNNDFALALNMSLPLFFFMARAEEKKWMRVTIRFLMVCVIISVVGTYSRGGLVGLLVVVFCLLMQSRQKVLAVMIVGVGLLCVATFATLQWKERMGGFMHGNLDESAETRLSVWQAGWNLVHDYPITGGGFDVYTDENVIRQYLPPSGQSDPSLHGPHSIYFQMLGEQGFVGFSLFLLLLGCCLAKLFKLRRIAKRRSDLEWMAPYANMFTVTLLAYMANGATLGRAYFDFSYQIVACVVILQVLYRREMLAFNEAELPAAEEMQVVAV
jgi:putative inorganic carbon (HCO3(-)) transporter